MTRRRLRHNLRPMNRRRALGTVAGLLAVALGGVGAAAAQSPAPFPEWQSGFARDHPLVGRIVRLADGVALEPEALVAALGRSDFVLLGEKHDNADHHALQAWILDALIAAGRRPAVAWEMLSADQAPALAAYLARPDATAAGLGVAVGWRGWPDWSLYAPIAEVALNAKLPMLAADLGQDMLSALSRRGIEAAPPGLSARLGLDRNFAPAQRALLERELTDSHCGQAPSERLGRMMDVQRARDAAFANALVQAAAQGENSVLIAGAGHVRRDFGVPWHLANLAPGRVVLSLAFVEVDPDRPDPAAYELAVDFAWFTPRQSDEDPCAANALRLRRLRP